MILINATIKYKNYDPENLSKGSHKRVCISCDQCGRVKWVKFKDYHKLCRKCGNKNKRFGKYHSNETKKLMSDSKKGDKNPFYGKTHSDGSKKLIGDAERGKLNHGWRGGIAGVRMHVKREYNCIKLNSKFEGVEAHHIMSGVVIYLPKNLHNRKYGISHDLKNNINMNIINELAINYLKGDY